MFLRSARFARAAATSQSACAPACLLSARAAFGEGANGLRCVPILNRRQASTKRTPPNRPLRDFDPSSKPERVSQRARLGSAGSARR